LELWVALGKIDHGCADAAIGNTQRGINLIREGVSAYEATGGKLWSPYFLSLLADALAKAGLTQEGLQAIEKGLLLAEHTGERFSLAELHRIKGELILKTLDLVQERNPANDSSRGAVLSRARACFVEALTIARQQGTRSWLLRAALSMDRLELMQRNSTHARLGEIYSSFTEGFETADLRQARALLGAVPLA